MGSENHQYIRQREVKSPMEENGPPEPVIENFTVSSLSVKVLGLLLPYLHPKRYVRIIYFVVVGTVLSLLKLNGYSIYVHTLAARDSFLNVVFMKLGMGWTLSAILLLRTCCLPLHANWRLNLWNLLLRVSTITFFYYFWCQVVFPSVEKWTGTCVKNGIVANMSNISKERCVKLKDHHFYSFDISGHSFLMPFCILAIMEECRELVYVYYLGKYLGETDEGVSTSTSKEDDCVTSSSLSPEELLRLKKKYKLVIPGVVLISGFTAFIVVIWDIAFLVTTHYYHTLFEKFLGTTLAILSWYIAYPVILKSVEAL